MESPSAFIPLGNHCGSATRCPFTRPACVFCGPVRLRPACQQSSRLTYWYPASAMPFCFIAVAVSWIRSWVIQGQPYGFHVLKPIGGVSASPLSESASAAGVPRDEPQRRRQREPVVGGGERRGRQQQLHRHDGDHEPSFHGVLPPDAEDRLSHPKPGTSSDRWRKPRPGDQTMLRRSSSLF